jgi:hypothetical protein
MSSLTSLSSSSLFSDYSLYVVDFLHEKSFSFLSLDLFSLSALLLHLSSFVQLLRRQKKVIKREKTKRDNKENKFLRN